MIGRIIEGVMRAITIALAIAFIFAVLLNFANVVGRYLFSEAILGADELQILVMVWITFLGAVVVTWHGQHLRMDVLFGTLTPWGQKCLRFLETVLLLVLAGFVVVQSGRYVMLMIKVGRTSETTGMPMAFSHLAVTIGFAMIVLLCVARLGLALRTSAAEQHELVPDENYRCSERIDCSLPMTKTD